MAIPSNNKKGAFHVVRKLSNGSRDSGEHVGAHGKTDRRKVYAENARKYLKGYDKGRVPIGKSSRSKIGKNGVFTLQQLMGLARDDVGKDKPWHASDFSRDFLTGGAADPEEARNYLKDYDEWESFAKEDPKGFIEAVTDVFDTGDILDKRNNINMLGVLARMANTYMPEVDDGKGGKTKPMFKPAQELLKFLRDYDKDTVMPEHSGNTFEVHRTKYQAQPVRDENGNIIDWTYEGATPLSNGLENTDVFQFDLPKGKDLEKWANYIAKGVSEDEDYMIPFSNILPITDADVEDGDPFKMNRDRIALKALNDIAEGFDVQNKGAYEKEVLPEYQRIKDYADQWNGPAVYDLGLNAMNEYLRSGNKDAKTLVKSPIMWAIKNIARNNAIKRGGASTDEKGRLEDAILKLTGFGEKAEEEGGEEYRKNRAVNSLMTEDDLANFPITNPGKWRNFVNHLNKTIAKRASGLEGQATRDITDKDRKNATKSMAKAIRDMMSGKVADDEAKGYFKKALEYGADVDAAFDKVSTNNPEFLEGDNKDRLEAIRGVVNEVASGTTQKETTENIDDNPYTHVPEVPEAPKSLQDAIMKYRDELVEGEYAKALANLDPQMAEKERPRIVRKAVSDFADKLWESAGPDHDIDQAAVDFLMSHDLLDKYGITDYTNPAVQEELANNPMLRTWIDDILPLEEYADSGSAAPDIADILKGKYKEDSEMEGALDLYDKYLSENRDKRIEELMKLKGYGEWQRPYVEKLVDEENDYISNRLWNEAREANEKYKKRVQRGKDLASTRAEQLLQSKIDEFMSNNKSLMDVADPKAALEMLRKGEGKPGTLLRDANGKYRKLTGIDSSGTATWQIVNDPNEEQSINDKLKSLTEGMDPEEREEFESLLDSSLSPKGFNISDITSQLDRSRAARKIKNIGSSIGKRGSKSKSTPVDTGAETESHVKDLTREFQDTMHNLALRDPTKYGQYLTEDEARHEAYNALSRQFQQRTAERLQKEHAEQDEKERKEREKEAIQSRLRKYEQDYTRGLEVQRFKDRLAADPRARLKIKLAVRRDVAKRHNDEAKSNADEEALKNEGMESRHLANMSYNKAVADDEKKAAQEKEARKKQYEQQAAEAKRAKAEASKQQKQVVAAKDNNKPSSEIQKQAGEALRARREASKQQKQADNAAGPSTEELAAKHRANVKMLMDLGYSEEEAQAIVNKRKPAEPKDDNGISSAVSSTMANLSKGY